MTDNPTVSVIIPTYNRAHTLGRAIDSVLHQTRPADEIIIVDDGSTDKTAALLENYTGLIHLEQTNAGVSTARNTGIAQASSSWIAFLDSDDEWLPSKLQHQLVYVTRTKSGSAMAVALTRLKNIRKPGVGSIPCVYPFAPFHLPQ